MTKAVENNAYIGNNRLNSNGIVQIPGLKSDEKRWSELSTPVKFLRILRALALIALLLAFIYFFIASINFISDAFRLLGGTAIADLFKNNRILQNPIATVQIGLLVTAFVHSSSTVTSISVAMVNANALTVQQGVYIVMGANVGTAVTSTLVALFNSADRQQFKRAFAAATIHDMYNWLGVVVLFPIEWILQVTTGEGFLVWLSGIMVSGISAVNGTSEDAPTFVEGLVKPFTKKIIQIDADIISDMARGFDTSNKTIAKHFCIDKHNSTISRPCSFLLNLNMSDASIGAILIIVALLMLLVCITGTIKVLGWLLGGQIQKVVKRLLNFEIKGRFSCMTGYVCILVGMVGAFLIQSSSIFVATLIPLVALDLLTLERFWVFEVGADVGTSGVSILAAFSTDTLKTPLQLAMCHFLFNFLSIPLFYSIPAVRRIPLGLSAYVGETTARYKWFAFAYIAFMFIVLPFLFLGLSIAGTVYLIIFLVLCIIFLTFFGIIGILQHKKPEILPEKMRTWHFLPDFMYKFSFWDKIVMSLFGWCICGCCKDKIADSNENENKITWSRDNNHEKISTRV